MAQLDYKLLLSVIPSDTQRVEYQGIMTRQAIGAR